MTHRVKRSGLQKTSERPIKPFRLQDTAAYPLFSSDVFPYGFFGGPFSRPLMVRSLSHRRCDLGQVQIVSRIMTAFHLGLQRRTCVLARLRTLHAFRISTVESRQDLNQVVLCHRGVQHVLWLSVICWVGKGSFPRGIPLHPRYGDHKNTIQRPL